MIAILMGSKSDWEIMRNAAETLTMLGVEYEAKVLSAHRTPDQAIEYAEQALGRLQAIIAGAGMAAHLAGIMAAKTRVPVLGVPLPGSAVNGLDSLLSTVQMPGGIPVATFGIGKHGAINAALFAAQMLAMHDDPLAARLDSYRKAQAKKVLEAELD